MKPHVVIKYDTLLLSPEAIDKASISEENVQLWALGDDEMILLRSREVFEGILSRSLLAEITFTDINWYFRSGFEYHADGDESGLFCEIGIENFENESDYREFRKALFRNGGILILTIYDVTKESFKVNWASKSILDFRPENHVENNCFWRKNE